MTSNVVLSAALRANLLSLQNTQGLVDITQNRLATGKKVNSALDGPQAFFASQALSNRANDLTRLLDSIGQSIQVIKAADNGITALTKLVEQADSVAQSARDALAAGTVEAKVTGVRDLRNTPDLTTLPGIAAGDQIVLSVTDEDGNPIDIAAFGAATGPTATLTINAGDSIEELMTAINDLHVDDGNGFANGTKAFNATLNEAGHVVIKTIDGGDFRMRFTSIAAPGDAGDLAVAADLGFGEVARIVPDGTAAAGSNTVEFQAVADVALRSFPLVSDATGTVALRSDLITTLRSADLPGTLLFAGVDNANDDYQIGVNGGSVQNIDLFGATAISIQEFIDRINTNTTLNSKIVAEFDDETGELSIRPINSTVQSLEFGIASGAAGLQANWGFGLNGATAMAGTNSFRESVRLAAAAADLAGFEDDYNNLREQIDQLVGNGDTGYRGTNLLNGDNLTTFFNEFRSSSLTTQGVTFNSEGLGLNEANFSRIDSTDGALAEVRDALETVRSFGSTLANDLSVIQARENFTKNIINTLTEGSDKLVVADQNEEGAKLLALQTRQSLGVTALSLASQSQQSILRLFQ